MHRVLLLVVALALAVQSKPSTRDGEYNITYLAG